MQNNHYDVIVIGAGIHGAGVAQAAASKGYSVLVLEKNTIGGGTSCKSSKLIHGGLRYLETAQLSLVRECLQERRTLLKIAPDLVKLRPFYIPIYKHTVRRPIYVRMGLSVYAILASLERAGRFKKLAQQQWANLDGLRTKDLQAVYQYFDAQTDDKKLTNAVLQSAVDFGAEINYPAKVNKINLSDDISCVEYTLYPQSKDQASDIQEAMAYAKVIVNAAGPWVNLTTACVEPPLAEQAVDFVQGSHIVLNRAIDNGVYYLEANQDQRAIFAMPWQGNTLVGTTEILFSGDPDQVEPLAREKDYLLETYNYYFPDDKNDTLRIVDAFAGLRVLPRSNQSEFKRSRDTKLISDRNYKPRMISIYGGKLTAYRATAERVMTQIAPALPAAKRRGDTRKIKLLLPK